MSRKLYQSRYGLAVGDVILVTCPWLTLGGLGVVLEIQNKVYCEMADPLEYDFDGFGCGVETLGGWFYHFNIESLGPL